MECVQCGFPELNQEFLLPVPPTAVCHAVENSQLGTARGAAPVLAMIQQGCPGWFFLMAHMPGTAPEPPHSCAHSCCNLLVLYQDKSGKADLPSVWGQTAPGLNSDRLKLALALLFSSAVLFFFFPFPPYGKGNAFVFPLPIP